MPAARKRAAIAAHYRRLIGAALGIILALVALALLSLYLLLRPERFTAFLQARAQAAGLDLQLAYPASPSLLPHPAIELQGLTLSAPGASKPILVADHGEVELPWIALFQRNAGIAWLQLDAPRVDIDALRDWIHSLTPGLFEQAPSLPRIDAGISIFNGSLVGSRQQPWLDDVSINAGALYPGQPFHLDLSATLPDTRPVSLSLSLIPAVGAHRVELNQLQLQLNSGPDRHAHLQGQLDWLGGRDLSIELQGVVSRSGHPDAQLQLQMQPDHAQQPLQLQLHYSGRDVQADLQLPPQQLLTWWSLLNTRGMTPPAGLPQWQGHFHAEQLNLGQAQLQGLQIDATPPPATSAPAAATSTPTNR